MFGPGGRFQIAGGRATLGGQLRQRRVQAAAGDSTRPLANHVSCDQRRKPRTIQAIDLAHQTRQPDRVLPTSAPELGEPQRGQRIVDGPGDQAVEDADPFDPGLNVRACMGAGRRMTWPA